MPTVAFVDLYNIFHETKLQDIFDLVRRQEKVCSSKIILAYFILQPLL